MKHLVWVLFVGFFSVWALPSQASSYTYKDGFYWDSYGNAYSRSKVYYPTTYYRDYYGYLHAYPATYYYSYYQVPVVTKTVKEPYPTKIEYSANWKDELAKALRARDDYYSFKDLVHMAGFDRPDMRLPGSPYDYQSGSYGNYGVAQGNTAFAYSVNQLKEAYGETNVNLALQAADRHTDKALGFGNDARRNFAGMVGDLTNNQRAVAEIREKWRGLVEVGKTLNATPTSKTVTSVSAGSVGGAAPATMPRADDNSSTVAEAKLFLQQLAIPACGGCHMGKDAKGAFDILSFPGGDDTLKEKVNARVFSTDPKKVMPPPEKGKLTLAQKRRFAMQ